MIIRNVIRLLYMLTIDTSQIIDNSISIVISGRCTKTVIIFLPINQHRARSSSFFITLYHCSHTNTDIHCIIYLSSMSCISRRRYRLYTYSFTSSFLDKNNTILHLFNSISCGTMIGDSMLSTCNHINILLY